MRKKPTILQMVALGLSSCVCLPIAVAADGSPALQAIDPSQAKMDKLPVTTPAPPPSPNPLGRVNGAPVSGNRQPPMLPQAPYAGQPGYPYPYPPAGYQYPPGYYPPQQAGYPPAYPQAGYPAPYQTGYPPQYAQPYGQPPTYAPPAYPQQGYPPAYAAPPAGYAPQGYPAAYPPRTTYPPQPAYPPAGYPPASAYPPAQAPRAGYPPANIQPVATRQPSGYPNEGMIPDFNKPLPAAPPGRPGAPSNNGQGWATNVPMTPQSNGDEDRVMKLEQAAFGSTYPEHEVEDRVDHLEKEIFGSTTQGSMSDRISKLETKIGGAGAFGHTNGPPQNNKKSRSSSSEPDEKSNHKKTTVASHNSRTKEITDAPHTESPALAADAGSQSSALTPGSESQSPAITPGAESQPSMVTAAAGSPRSSETGLSANQMSLNQGIPTLSPGSAINQGIPPLSPENEQNQSIPPISPGSAINQGIPPLSAMNEQNQGMPPLAPGSEQNQSTPQVPSNGPNQGTPAWLAGSQPIQAPPSQFPGNESNQLVRSQNPSSAQNQTAPPQNQFPPEHVANSSAAQKKTSPSHVVLVGEKASPAVPPKHTKDRAKQLAQNIRHGAVNSPEVQAVVDSIPTDPKAGDYFSGIRKFDNDTVARWTSFPITVKLPAESPESWKKNLQIGISAWNKFIPVQDVPNTENSDVEVTWVNHLLPGVLGITRLSTPQKGSIHVEIWLLRPTFYVQDIPEHALQAAFLHELGHGIGLFGHSSGADDLMSGSESALAERGKSVKALTVEAKDLNTLKHVYDSPAVPAGFFLSQPIEWSFQKKKS